MSAAVICANCLDILFFCWLIHVAYILHTLCRSVAQGPSWLFVKPFLCLRRTRVGKVEFVREKKDTPGWVLSPNLLEIRLRCIFVPLQSSLIGTGVCNEL